jgi:hypothetical protein
MDPNHSLNHTKMKIPTHHYPLIGKTVPLNIREINHASLKKIAFFDRAVEHGWTAEDIECIKQFLHKRPTNEHNTILEHYCVPFHRHSLMKHLHQADVHTLLSFLGREPHYLAVKPLLQWDEYDWANYQSLERKATKRLTQVFAVYSDTVLEEDKYLVTTKPTQFYPTYQEADQSRNELLRLHTNIFSLWIEE